MATLEKEILVTLHPTNIEHFDRLGYEIPKQVDKQGRLKIKKGTKILVKVNDLPHGCGIKLTKICDECGKRSDNQPYHAIIKCRKEGDGKDRCRECAQEIRINTKKNNMKYENSFEYWAKENDKEYLLDEFSNRNNNEPSKISKGTDEIYWWNCLICKNEYDMNLYSRTKGDACPYCSGHRVLKGYNDLWTTHPEVAKLLKDSQRGFELSFGSNQKEIFLCKDCGNEENKKVQYVVNKGFSCPKCGDGISYPEKIMFNVLEQLNIKFEYQKTFNWSQGKRYDFYIPSFNCIIETHGEQHYQEKFNIKGKSSKNKEQENDKLKERLAKENEIKKYIIVDCRKSELEFIKNNILLSILGNLFDLSNIDWVKCHEYGCKSIVKKACDLWNEGIKNTKEISNILKVKRTTATKYLKQGQLLGWCDYDPIKESQNSWIHIRSKRKIVQLTMNNEFIKQWNSLSEAEKTLNIPRTGISRTIRGIYKSFMGFKWVYAEDYNN